jgi:CRISPR/Cas system CSM-associated protein Csm4 (group 5 of RAMP superfamily)
MRILKDKIRTFEVIKRNEEKVVSFFNEFKKGPLKEIMLEDCVFVENNSSGYFIHFIKLSINDMIFLLLDMDPLDFQEKILNYVDTEDGAFPYCKTEEDAIKLLDELILYNYNNYK